MIRYHAEDNPAVSKVQPKHTIRSHVNPGDVTISLTTYTYLFLLAGTGTSMMMLMCHTAEPKKQVTDMLLCDRTCLRSSTCYCIKGKVIGTIAKYYRQRFQ